MQLNGSPLNSRTLNGASARGAVAEPQTIAPVVSMVWSARLLLNGVDASHLLAGRITTRREEGARAIADFDLQFLGEAVNPATYQGQTAELWFRHWVGGAWVDHLVFRGKITGPQFSLQTRVLSCECADQLNEQVELLDLATIDAITGGLWSADVFEAVEGRSRWDYASERMSTRPASLQLSLEGALQVTPWATTAPAWRVPPGAVLFESLEWAPVELSDRINVVEIEADYRFSRLRERHQPFAWEHPDWVGLSIIDGFCLAWRHDGTEMPDIAMITEASQSAGYQAVINAGWDRLPPSGSGALCTPPSSWLNQYPDLLVRAGWTSAMRWVQPVTEQYTLRVEAPASIAQAGEVVERERLAFETENDRASAFEDAEFTGPEAGAVQDALGDWVVDLRENGRLAEGAVCLLHVGRTRILGTHRGNRFVFQLPAADAIGFRLEHTLRVEDEVLGRAIVCQAKVFSIAHEWDLDSGSALTTVELAVSQGGGQVSDPLTLPPPPPSTPAGAMPTLIRLPSQFSGHVDGPPYNEAQLGFAGNYTNYNSTQERFERRFDIEAPEIPADHRDEYLAPRAQTYRVAVPTDLLEL